MGDKIPNNKSYQFCQLIKSKLSNIGFHIILNRRNYLNDMNSISYRYSHFRCAFPLIYISLN